MSDHATDILDTISTREGQGEPFALATVVRTVAMTAAKAGAKAVILPDGTISEGWIGGGCARAAVLKAAREALADGKARLVSVQPPDALHDKASRPARSATACASRRTCARARAPWTSSSSRCCRARRSWSAAPVRWRSRSPISAGGSASMSRCARPRPSRRRSARSSAGSKAMRCRSREAGARFVVVSTQGRGDEAALQAALAVEADYVAFVGSRKKAEALKAKLAEPASRRSASPGSRRRPGSTSARSRPRRSRFRSSPRSWRRGAANN